MDRHEHVKWCKDRAIEYLDKGDTKNAVASFVSDMNKHDETRGHVALQMLMMIAMSGDTGRIRECILGFN